MTIKLKGSTDGSVSLSAPADTSPSGTDITLTLPTDAGSANQFLKNSGTAGTLDYSSMVETSTGVGIGTASPEDSLHIKSNSGAIRLENTVVSNNDSTIAYDNTDLAFHVDPNNVRGSSNITFSGDGAERMRLDSSGQLGIGVTPIRALDVNSGSSSTYLRLTNDATGTANGDGFEIFVRNTDLEVGFLQRENSAMFFRTNDTDRMEITANGSRNHHAPYDVDTASTTQGAGSSWFFYRGRHSASSLGGGSTSFIVWSNGDVDNTNNSYGAISDVKLKENIVDATSQWDDLKAIQIRKYNFKEETGHQTHTQLGVVAQEVELVSPGLVTESPDRDDEGNDLGTTTKSVNYSVLYIKAVKALQEAMDRIETLETKVAALEAA